MVKLRTDTESIFFWIGFLFMILNINTSKAQTNEVYGEIVFDSLAFDVGTIEKNSKTLYVTYTNVGEGKLALYHVVTPCNCTTVAFSKEPISKGKKGKITIEIDPLKLPLGPFTRTVTILHDGSEKGHDQVTITGIKK